MPKRYIQLISIIFLFGKPKLLYGNQYLLLHLNLYSPQTAKALQERVFFSWYLVFLGVRLVQVNELLKFNVHAILLKLVQPYKYK